MRHRDRGVSEPPRSAGLLSHDVALRFPERIGLDGEFLLGVVPQGDRGRSAGDPDGELRDLETYDPIRFTGDRTPSPDLYTRRFLHYDQRGTEVHFAGVLQRGRVLPGVCWCGSRPMRASYAIPTPASTKTCGIDVCFVS